MGRPPAALPGGGVDGGDRLLDGGRPHETEPGERVVDPPGRSDRVGHEGPVVDVDELTGVVRRPGLDEVPVLVRDVPDEAAATSSFFQLLNTSFGPTPAMVCAIWLKAPKTERTMES